MVDRWVSRAKMNSDSQVERASAANNREEPQKNQHPIDIEKALTQLAGDRELFDEALGTFLDTMAGIVGELQSAASSADAPRLELAAHSLKGAASNICAEPVRQIAQRLEQMGKRGDFKDADSALADLQDRLGQLRRFAAALKED